jgi:type IV pilus assembly protein PilO
VGVAYWLYLLQPSLEVRTSLKAKLTDVEQKVAERERIAAQKERFVKEVALLQEAFRLALAKLPDQREIPGLFHAVSVAGKEAGMEFLLFEPKASVKPADKKGPDVKANLKPSDQRAEQKPAGGKGVPAKSAEPDRFYDEIPVNVRVKGLFNHVVFFFDKVAKLPGL